MSPTKLQMMTPICSRRRDTQATVPSGLRPGGQERGRRIEEVSVHLMMPTYCYGSVSMCLLDYTQGLQQLYLVLG